MKGWVMFFIISKDIADLVFPLGTLFSREHQYFHPSRNIFVRFAWKERKREKESERERKKEHSYVLLRLWFLSIFHEILQSFLTLKKFDDNFFQLLRVAQSDDLVRLLLNFERPEHDHNQSKVESTLLLRCSR